MSSHYFLSRRFGRRARKDEPESRRSDEPETRQDALGRDTRSGLDVTPAADEAGLMGSSVNRAATKVHNFQKFPNISRTIKYPEISKNKKQHLKFVPEVARNYLKTYIISTCPTPAKKERKKTNKSQ